jgi:D-sedoheptulose 7-phosphate isomerase
MDTKCFELGLREYFDTLCDTFSKVDTEQIAQMADVLYKAYVGGKQIFTMGNGGHANTAAHMINDIAKHTTSSDSKEEVVSVKGFRTMCLNDSISFVTGLANDLGFDRIFSEQLNNWCNEGDVVIGISGSGNSRNVLLAFKKAKERGATSICLTGKGGGKAKEVTDICIVVPSDKMVHIEDIHLAINHAVADELKKLVQKRTKLTG